jgi:transcriptional regulator GlxA family with amidase domain
MSQTNPADHRQRNASGWRSKTLPTPAVLGSDVLAELKEYIAAHLDEPIGVAALAKLAGLSQFHFTRMFTRSVGMTPHRFVVHLRLQRAMALMLDEKLTPATVACAPASPTRVTCRDGFGASTASLWGNS